MISPILFFLIIVLLFYRFYKWSTYKPIGFPPGPPRIPYLGGYIFFLLLNKDRLHLASLTLSKWYKSKYIGFWWGSSLITVINDYKGVRESFYRTEFDGKPVTYTVLMRHPEEQVRGIFFLEGPVWKAQRWFMLRYMRDFGFGRRHEVLECHIRDEIMSFVQQIRNGPMYEHEHEYFRKNSIVNVPKGMVACLINCFFQIVISERIPREEQASLFEVAKHSLAFQRGSDSYAKLLSVIPWIRHIFPEKSGYRSLLKANQGLYNFMKKFIDTQIETYNESHQRHFVDMYIAEIRKSENINDFSGGFSYDQLIFAMMDFFIPALTAIAAQIALLFQVGIVQPEIAMKIQAEIDQVVGHGRLPTLDDRVNMHYTEACLRESMRYDTPLPSGIPHKVLTDTTLANYTLPAGSFIILGHYAIAMDKEIWGDPEVFRPERFLDAEGKVDLKKDKSLPFGAGKRLCAGETFSRNLTFLFVTAMYQNFTIKLPPYENINKLLKGKSVGLITTTTDFWIKFEPR